MQAPFAYPSARLPQERYVHRSGFAAEDTYPGKAKFLPFTRRYDIRFTPNQNGFRKDGYNLYITP